MFESDQPREGSLCKHFRRNAWHPSITFRVLLRSVPPSAPASRATTHPFARKYFGDEANHGVRLAPRGASAAVSPFSVKHHIPPSTL